MLYLLALHALAAVVAPFLLSRFGRRAFVGLAAVPGVSAGYVLWQGGAVLAGRPPRQGFMWIPELGVEISTRLDPLSWVMALIVSGVGALVLLYCAVYFSAKASGLGRFAAVFLGFAGAMLGLVTVDNTIALYVMWEGTTVFSYLLIGHYFDRATSRRAAGEAIIVTTFGGLAMLGGLTMLGVAPGGSFSLSTLVSNFASGQLGPSAATNTALVLVLLGALSKSALVPFHFWLPAAMAAPTPVSAYLHSSAMVKAGVYLVARFTPGLAAFPVWRWLVVVIGVVTMLIGGYRSLRQYDLKLVLAYGTVSQLGFLMVLVGFGARAVALAGLAMLIAHSLFKSSLFLTVGAIDWAVGCRDLRQLSGLGRTRPGLALAGGLAAASMAGVAPFAGYVAKEAALEALVHGQGALALLALGGVVAGSVLTVAYTLRFVWGAFAAKPDLVATVVDRPTRQIGAVPLILAGFGLLVGLLPGAFETVVAPYAASVPGQAGHLTLFGGFGAALYLTLGILLAGIVLFVVRGVVSRGQLTVAQVTGRVEADDVYRHLIRGVQRVARATTAVVQRGSLAWDLMVILVVVVLGVGGVALTRGVLPASVVLTNSWLEVGAAVVTATGAVLAARARRRLKAVLLASVSGFGMVLLYESYGAPDLAITQLLAESVTLVVFVLAVRRMPPYFSDRPLAASRRWRLALAVAVGATVVVAAAMAAGARVAEPVSVDFPQEAYTFGYGRNIVNVTLVDIRAWDTVGELSVLLAAATGVASLVFIRSRSGTIDRVDRVQTAPGGVWHVPLGTDGQAILRAATLLELSGPAGASSALPGRQTWLRGSATLSPYRRSVILEVTTRLVFHTFVVLSLWLLFAGHNGPGGGFAGGIVFGIALALRYVAGGRYELGEALPVNPGLLLGSGLFTAALAGALPLAFGGTVLQSAIFHISLGPLGQMHVATALLLDIGVYLLVIGLVLDLLRSLGAEADRQAELAGMQAPEIAPATAGPDDALDIDNVRQRREARQ
ncbi:Na+/H+ antiporter subunit A [Buchananella hordeovulneris]|uniref:Na+/H+ antiporter subunit A n=1 Tax=Buchananella hordeovulneris TaxID=52770 RepID=A0A1Q5PUW5_9ACTO|nr:Na+/H+ antiporter subunit A [Buchananella hordeovulneris]OKL51357.1 Na+/H+ antiporter subunit A [Buchananella hordeovulneris]